MKTFITQAWLVVERCPTPHWVKFVIFCRFVYDIPSHLNDLILAWSTSLHLCEKVSHQNPGLVHKIFPFLKQIVSVIYFSDMLMELKRKVECSWACTFWGSLCFKGYRSLPWTLGWSKILEAFNCNWCDEYFAFLIF